MSRYLIGQEVVLTFYTYDLDGNLQNADTTPTLTVTVNGATVASDLANTATGIYTATFAPTEAGRHVAELEGLIDTNPDYGVQYVVVHDGLAEAQAESFPDGIASWESAVR